ncbi:hypothetical protein [uncultured Bradyrhizobium sp.]|mgnify:CR=1 FL=1|jgi:hypothetical protein|uniref:hypothetical protein n=1 Tax=uncultured Bradyrhizobium sp. TaxID=199684 RepID=UPI00263795A2|nr:hypothetical protein [uncultured Bradyrhizobium sp.]
MSAVQNPPVSVKINAWTGEAADSTGTLAAVTKPWATVPAPKSLMVLAAEIPDMRDWTHDKVGWGLVVEHRQNVSVADNCALAGMPEAIKELRKFRQGVVLGWSPECGTKNLIRYLEDGTTRNVKIGSDVKRGKTPDALPHYLLILGGPAKIPWKVQYTLNLCAAVGRLDLDGAGLENYVAAVVSNWTGTGAPLDVANCLLWSVNRGGTDITALMQTTVASPVLEALQGDSDIGAKAQFRFGEDATHAELKKMLSTNRPGLVVTTSHGRTGPLGDQTAMRRDLGLPVDKDNMICAPSDLLDAWEPNGAVWYAHACCSAGCDTGSVFADLFKPTALSKTLERIGELGAQSAPLPVALLGARKPLRAFIGHVEPTFDWTLTSVDMAQSLTESIKYALYDNLFEKNPMTVGGAFDSYYRQVGSLFNEQDMALADLQRFVPGAEQAALRARLGALDRRSLVIHGDPAVALPALGAQQ